ncbi:hypothetical protein T235_09050 [Tannerella sp. oral taxon BU063 isolate Cell 8/11]|jgi:hypothetical protein|uniref:RNA-binding protein n=1 Tax=Tannerella sp. oral taxon BU063 isolate Cell 8/11 TaxID=1411915 RepID=W2CZI8_9BACT|nr:hypothetical protein T235_09050 [Tannerella sp. oral taxon BU063 isolate Cell 8/11]
MKRVNAQSIGEILREFFAQNPEIGRRLDEVRLVHAWREMLGPGVAQATHEVYVRGATLHVVLDSAVLRSELMMWRDRLVRTLNERVGTDVIREIRFR